MIQFFNNTDNGDACLIAEIGKTADKSNRVLQTTPADGGVNIIRSPESERLVEAISTSPEVRAVVEQQKPEAPPASASVGSDVRKLADQTIGTAGFTESGEPILFAGINLEGSLILIHGESRIVLDASEVRRIADFLEDTRPTWE